ncbi:MAG TPA: oxidoreductase [Rubrivivax sp.]|nr:oxidoreductase [Rubrivivax sp.]
MSDDARVALVTGASAGIGKQIVRRLLREGWTVYGAARRLEQMADIAAEGAHVLSLDVADEASLSRAVQGLLAAEGRIDALVNNAGYGSYGALEDVPIAEARRQFEVNVFGLVRLSQLVLPSMRAAGRGRIVNISSMAGRGWTPLGGWYHATKHAVEVLSDALRVEVAPFGVQVVIVQPGRIKSEWSATAARTLRASATQSAYRERVEPFAALLEDYRGAASPEVVVDAVMQALNAARPRRRYATPLDARIGIFLHWLLPDASWEWLTAAGVRAATRRIGKTHTP